MNKRQTEIYERNINSSIIKKDENTFVTKASILDLNHNMIVILTFDIESKTITDAYAQMVKCPFKICRATLVNMKKLIGLKIERGINKKISHIVGRSHGCSHLFELCVDAVRLTSNVMLGLNFNEEEWRDEWKERYTPDEVFIERTKPFLKDTCYPFSDRKNNKNEEE